MSNDLRLATENGDEPFKPEEAGFKITCARCERDITVCICAADWLGYRALWVAADRELQRLKALKLDVDKVKAAAAEFTGDALKDIEKHTKTIEILQKTLGNAISILQLYSNTLTVHMSKSQVRDLNAQIDHLEGVLASTKS